MSEPEVEEMVRERPYVLQQIQMQILYDMAGLLEELVERNTRFHVEWKDTIPQGKFKPLTLPITGTLTVLNTKNTSTMPWMRFTIFNDGPNGVYIMVNDEQITQDTTPLNIGEQLSVDTEKRLIERVELHCALGNTASVRIFALR